jgi:hypothetical protein
MSTLSTFIINQILSPHPAHLRRCSRCSTCSLFGTVSTFQSTRRPAKSQGDLISFQWNVRGLSGLVPEPELTRAFT